MTVVTLKLNLKKLIKKFDLSKYLAIYWPKMFIIMITYLLS